MGERRLLRGGAGQGAAGRRCCVGSWDALRQSVNELGGAWGPSSQLLGPIPCSWGDAGGVPQGEA